MGPWIEWDSNEIKENLPIVDTHKFGPVKTTSDPQFGKHNDNSLRGSVFFPTAGYINDPQLSAHNLQRAAENRGGKFKFNSSVVKILQDKGRVSGVELSDGSKIHSRIVVNVAGPHSMKINKMAGVEKSMNIKTFIYVFFIKIELFHWID